MTAAVLLSGMPEGAVLAYRSVDWRFSLDVPSHPSFLTEMLFWNTSLGSALGRVNELSGSRAVLFEPGGLSIAQLEHLQQHVDVIAITCPPRYDEEVTALAIWKVLEKERSRKGHRAVPVILPVERWPRDAYDANLGAAARLRSAAERLIDQPPRLLPPTLPPLPRPAQEALIRFGPARLHPMFVAAARRLYRGLEVLAEDPDIAWPDFQERWRAIDAATPLPAMPWARHARLAEDLAGYAVTGGPDEAELAAAPYLDFWAEIWRPAPVLTGIVRGHPSIANDRPIVTSDVIAMDAAAGWARTLSRLYRLGSPQQSEADTEPTQH